MAEFHCDTLTRKDLAGKTIDAHSHAGVALSSYARAEYPYARTIEGLYYQQLISVDPLRETRAQLREIKKIYRSGGCHAKHMGGYSRV